jgi:beta-N-acetylhexosaminidase
VKSPPSAEPLAAAVGDTLRLQTGVILDHNRNPVPDGTLVQFIQRDRIQGLVNIIASVPTSNGVAALDYVLEASLGQGQFRITAVSGAADISQEVDISIQGDARVAIIVPTPAPTETNTPRPTPTATAEPTETPAPIATPMPATPTPPQEPGIRILLSEFLMLSGVLMGLLATGMLALLWSHQQPTIQLTQRIGLLLWGLVGGLVVYNYFALGLPGTAVLHHLGGWAGLFTTLGGGAAGLGLFHVLGKSE